MISCSFCGRPNTDESRFCIDCGKAIGASAANAASPSPPPSTASAPSSTTARGKTTSGAHRRPSPTIKKRRSGAEPAYAIVPPTRTNMAPASRTGSCTWCGNAIDPALPFCAHCGRRTDATLSAATSCASCGNAVLEADTFCGACGTPVRRESPNPKPDPEVRTLVFAAKRRDVGPRLAVLDDKGEVAQTVPFVRAELTVGRGACDLSFPDDIFLSPLHAQFALRDGVMTVRDLGASNRTWVFVESPYELADDDVLLVGSQLLQFRRIGSPAPFTQDSDGTRRIGSLTTGPDVAMVAQLRADGSTRDCHYLAAGRAMSLGRDTGDWIFPYDQTMSGRHAEVRADAGRFVVQDLGSRNGIAVAVRGERALAAGQRVLVGDQLLRVESV